MHQRDLGNVELVTSNLRHCLQTHHAQPQRLRSLRNPLLEVSFRRNDGGAASECALVDGEGVFAGPHPDIA